MKVAAIFVVLAYVALVAGDLYLQAPRGCNDRLNEANTNRNNGNRLFDSQNNAKGGYCYGPAMTYYEGSQLSVEWTAQHGCSNDKMTCNLVIQYMCGAADETDGTKAIRDGTTTDTPDDTVASVTQVETNNANIDSAYNPNMPKFVKGMNEPLSWYDDCKTRERNQGLYIADRAKQGGLTGARITAIYTRQNNNGNRNGLECAEERDYYPYFHATPWKDVAVLTDDTSRCAFYQKESYNVHSRGRCVLKAGQNTNPVPNQESTCVSSGNTWVIDPAWGIAAPECLPAPWSRDNHLGNGMGDGQNNMYNWTIPTSSVEPCIVGNNCHCVLRLRYNISTADVDGFGFVDSTSNGDLAPLTNNPTENLGFGDILTATGATINGSVTLAADTTQFARTFQDRSFIFGFAQRPSNVASTARIFNLNVRGKRGNIVQTYPATEYDFIPEQLQVKKGDYIHFQWTGCDNNPAGNAGEGTAQTDRSNMVQIENLSKSVPASASWLGAHPNLFQGKDLQKYFGLLGQTNCVDTQDQNNVQNCYKLNAASRYFDGGLLSMNLTGTFHYMSTRNNNFSNRGQKGAIIVSNLLPNWAIALTIVGGFTFLASGGVGGMMLYAKSHPHSMVGNAMSKI